MAGISGVSAGIVLAGRYTLSRRLWHRGIGELWLASDSVRRRRVWIQISAAGGLQNAVSSLTRVQHPAVAVVREAGQKRIAHEDRVITDHASQSHKLIHKSDSYIEFAVYDQDKGVSLSTRLAKGTLTSAELAAVALNVAEVFETVHAAGLVHGWLHTDSVWLGAQGSVFVDLALGLAFEGDATTLAMEVESGFVTSARLSGESASAADDVYALSWLLYVCIFGWEIVREDLSRARIEAGIGYGAASSGLATLGIAELTALLAFRREIAIGRIVEYFGDNSELAVLFANCMAGEVTTRPSMAEVVAVLRGHTETVAALPVPAIVAERAAAAGVAAALAAEAAAEALGATVEDAALGTWTPQVSPTAGGAKGTITLAEFEVAREAAVTQALALAEAEERHRAELEIVRAELEAARAEYAAMSEEAAAAASAIAVAQAIAEIEERQTAERALVVGEATGGAAVALVLAEVEERHRVESAAAEERYRGELAAAEERHAAAREEAIAAASAVAVAAAIAEVEERYRSEREAAEANQAAVVEAAVFAALAEAVATYEVEVEAARAEAARSAILAAERNQAAAVEAAVAVAVAAALAEAAANADTKQVAAHAAAAPPSGPSTTATSSSQSPKPKPWLVASGGAVLGIAVGIGIGYGVHGSGHSTTPVAAPPNGLNVANSSSAQTASSSAAPAGSSTTTAATAAATSTAGAPTPSASTANTPTSGAPTTDNSAAPSSPASPGAPTQTTQTTPPAVAPTSAQQAESQTSSIIAKQVTDTSAAGALSRYLSRVKAAPVGSGAYTQAVAALNGLINSEANQGAISPAAAQALRQQVTYLLSFSGS